MAKQTAFSCKDEDALKKLQEEKKSELEAKINEIQERCQATQDIVKNYQRQMESIEADAHKITRDLEVIVADQGDSAAEDKLQTVVENDYYRGLL